LFGRIDSKSQEIFKDIKVKTVFVYYYGYGYLC
jgi:hypothetical protein